MIEKAAATAAQWWTDELVGPQATLGQQAGATADDAISSDMSTGLFDMLRRKGQEQLTPEKVATFKEALETKIIDGLAREADRLARYSDLANEPRVSLGVDYGPDFILSEALDEAGIDLVMGLLPLKTNMNVTASRVSVGKGYAAPWEDIYKDGDQE